MAEEKFLGSRQYCIVRIRIHIFLFNPNHFSVYFNLKKCLIVTLTRREEGLTIGNNQ